MPEKTNDISPSIPRRTLLAAMCSACVAGGAVYLATVGQVTAPETQIFRFVRGVSLATGEEQRLRAYLLNALRDDRMRVVIVGHSGTSGDATANQQLSEARAMFAADIATDIGIDPARVDFAGVGGFAPLARSEGVAERAWQAELARVEITIQVRR
ncbi:OmpA family protein [Yoonia maricola]|uniref:OmpA family protein n=1 Tax=Yoonia maricola TaxID=420999 RepID=A0A2M8WM37_9RHOB|nr:OmpA family protein [Yoonia maricola]PJI91997.1 OmpA family protein [Yoonia maricola]